MAKTLHIHIGHYKTGTTALQAFFAQNRERLLEAGLDYAALGLILDKHNAFAAPLLQGQFRHAAVLDHDNVAKPREFWERLYGYVHGSPAEHVLISSEEFIRIGDEPRRIEDLDRVAHRAEGIDFRIICYLRPPGAHLESWYNQLVKLNRPIGHRARSIAVEFDRVNVDYRLALQPWADIFGKENVVVRGYRSDWRGTHGLYWDFLGLFEDIEPPQDLAFPGEDPNPRIDDRTTELVRTLNRIGASEAQIKAELARFGQYLSDHELEEALPEAIFTEVHRGAVAGLDWVSALPHSNIDHRQYRSDPPRLRPEWEDYSAAVLEYALRRLLELEKAQAGPKPGKAGQTATTGQGGGTGQAGDAAE